MPGVILNAPGEGTAAIVGDTAKTIVGLRPVFSAQVRSDLSGPVCEVTLLGAGQSIAFEQRTDGLHLTLPSAAPAGLADNIAYVFVMARVCPAAISGQMRLRSGYGLTCFNAPATIPGKLRKPSATVLPRLPTLRAGASVLCADSAVGFP
jgi:hypothetical protein